MRTFRTALFALPAVTGAALAGVMHAPGAYATGPISPTSLTYVASLAGTNAFIAIVKSSGEARAYVCDGDANIGMVQRGTPKFGFLRSSGWTR